MKHKNMKHKNIVLGAAALLALGLISSKGYVTYIETQKAIETTKAQRAYRYWCAGRGGCRQVAKR